MAKNSCFLADFFLNGKSLCPKKLSGKVGYPPPLTEICLVVFEGLPKFLANMTNETFQACHLGTHLAIEEMPQTVQPGQTRQTRLSVLFFIDFKAKDMLAI